MFSDSHAKKFFGKKWRIIFPVTKLFTDDLLLPKKIYADFFSSDKVFNHFYNHKNVLGHAWFDYLRKKCKTPY